LTQLVSAELIYRHGMPPHATYLFKHALVQDAAYGTLLREPRRGLHARIATVVEGQFPEIVTTQPERLAHHFDAAGLTAPAIDYYHRAANRAMAASANAEAIVHLKRGLELIASIPASAERSSRELDFRLALGPPLMATQGWGSAEAEANYARARVLGSEVGESAELFRSLVGLWVYEVCRPDRPDARRPLEVSQELLTLAAKLGGDDLGLLAEYVACVSCHWAGRFTCTRSHAAQVVVLYDPERHRGPKSFMMDPAMVAMSFESMSLWYLGYPERAHQRGLAALSMDRTVAHPFSLCWVLWQEVCLRILRGEPELTAARAKAHLALAREQGFPLDNAVASMFEIWREAQATGRCEDDRAEAFRNAQSEAMTLGFSATAPIFATLFAQCLEKHGKAEEALAVLEAAVVQIGSTGYNVWEPEVHRVMGDLFLQRNPSTPDQAEFAYRRAVERARSQEAKSWELRAATSLARVWRDQGKRDEARDLLTPVYKWFTEGFDTSDLKEAKALLQELAA
jgi:predicted ATPase